MQETGGEGPLRANIKMGSKALNKNGSGGGISSVRGRWYGDSYHGRGWFADREMENNLMVRWVRGVSMCVCTCVSVCRHGFRCFAWGWGHMYAPVCVTVYTCMGICYQVVISRMKWEDLHKASCKVPGMEYTINNSNYYWQIKNALSIHYMLGSNRHKRYNNK